MADILQRWHNLEAEKERLRTDKSFFVPIADIQANSYDLTINKYKETVYAEQVYDKPHQIIEDIKLLDEERNQELKELEELLK